MTVSVSKGQIADCHHRFACHSYRLDPTISSSSSAQIGFETPKESLCFLPRSMVNLRSATARLLALVAAALSALCPPPVPATTTTTTARALSDPLPHLWGGVLQPLRPQSLLVEVYITAAPAVIGLRFSSIVIVLEVGHVVVIAAVDSRRRPWRAARGRRAAAAAAGVEGRKHAAGARGRRTR